MLRPWLKITHGDAEGVKLAEAATHREVNGPAQGWGFRLPRLDATITGVETAVWPKPDMTGYSIYLSPSFALGSRGEALKSKPGS